MIDVLIVEDSAAIRKILKRILRRSTLPIGAILEAGDGIEGLKVLERQTVNLILSDINMPNMSGIEMLKAIAANPAYSEIPVIMITIEGSQALVLNAVKWGAAGYIRRPFNADEVLAKLDAVMGIHSEVK